MMSSSTTFASQARQTDAADPGRIIKSDIPASELLKFTASDYALLTGKKMNNWQRISFGILKIKLKRELKKNPDLLPADFYRENKKISVGLVIVIVLLALLLLFVIVLGIGYHGGL
jgi:hypothetical protein